MKSGLSLIKCIVFAVTDDPEFIHVSIAYLNCTLVPSALTQFSYSLYRKIVNIYLPYNIQSQEQNQDYLKNV